MEGHNNPSYNPYSTPWTMNNNESFYNPQYPEQAPRPDSASTMRPSRPRMTTVSEGSYLSNNSPSSQVSSIRSRRARRNTSFRGNNASYRSSNDVTSNARESLPSERSERSVRYDDVDSLYDRTCPRLSNPALREQDLTGIRPEEHNLASVNAMEDDQAWSNVEVGESPSYLQRDLGARRTRLLAFRDRMPLEPRASEPWYYPQATKQLPAVDGPDRFSDPWSEYSAAECYRRNDRSETIEYSNDSETFDDYEEMGRGGDGDNFNYDLGSSLLGPAGRPDEFYS